jgi:hypothetical protein
VVRRGFSTVVRFDTTVRIATTLLRLSGQFEDGVRRCRFVKRKYFAVRGGTALACRAG